MLGALVLIEGLKPLKLTKMMWFKDKMLSRRTLKDSLNII